MIILSIFFVQNSYAQDDEPALAKVYYTLKHKRDTTKKDSIYFENMILYVGKNISLFTSLDRVEQKLKIGKSIEEQTKNWTGPGSPRFKALSGLRKTSNQDIFQFQKEKKIIINEYLILNYLYEDSFDEIEWRLFAETKYFNKIKCQKATANYKGRKWEVWFAPEIPFETGPWKLHGLPGLIVEAVDSTKQIQFLFNGFENLNDNQVHNLIKIPNNAIKANLVSIIKLKSAMYANAKGFFTAQLQAARGILDAKEVEGFSFKKINNPIELTENK
ncbi:MAG: GLPGLI family protein [Pedobacter sp.]|nr:MAG: GLPGLI family protein [Pedobacter sp.]